MGIVCGMYRYTWAGVLGALAKQGRAKEALEVRPSLYPMTSQNQATHLRI